MKLRKITAGLTIGLLALGPEAMPAGQRHGESPVTSITIDTCQGADLHENFGEAPAYAINLISISKKGTYDPIVDGRFGCPNDNSNTSSW